MDKNLIIDNKLFSIIIPVYNVEKYLIRCLDSIFNQKCDFDFEVIVVDDCSTDGSLYILKEYEKRFNNLVIVQHTINRKLSAARLSGIGLATGEYIVHIDSDDWIVVGGLNIIGNEIIANDFDVIVFNYIRGYSEFDNEIVCLFDKPFIQTDVNEVSNYFLSTCWNKVVKRSLHNDVIYGQVGINSEEDLLYCVEILVKSHKIKFCDNFYYVYFQNKNSLTLSVDPENFLIYKPLVLKELYKIFIKYNVDYSLSSNILNYYENWVFLFVYKVHNLKYNKLDIFENLMIGFSQVNGYEVKRYNLIKLSTESFFRSFFHVCERFGARIALSILARSQFVKYFNK